MWTLVGFLVKVVTDSHLLESCCVSIDELIVDIFMDVDTCASVACLTKVHVDTPNTPFNCLLDVGIWEDDIL